MLQIDYIYVTIMCIDKHTNIAGYIDMKIITAYFAQFLWITVLITGFFIQPDSLAGYLDRNGILTPGLIQSDSAQNVKNTKTCTTVEGLIAENGKDGSDTDKLSDRGGFHSKRSELEQYIATFDVGEAKPSSSGAAGTRTDPSAAAPPAADSQAGAGKSDVKPESRGGAKSADKPAETSNHASSDTSDPPAVKQGFNQIVLNITKIYKGGKYPYLLNNDYANYNGVTENLYYDGQLFLKANPSGNRASHCSGITFEVFFKSMQEWNRQRGLNTGRIGNLSYSQMQDFMLQWYVASGQKEQGNLTTALAQYGLGKRITDLNAAQPGDFIDLSRENNTGHTVVFLGWVWDDGQIVGLKYWSSQGSTGGISKNTEYFNVLRKDGTKYGKIMIDKLYIGRVTP